MPITRRQRGDVVILDLTGWFDEEDHGLDAIAVDVLATTGKLLLNLSGVTFVDPGSVHRLFRVERLYGPNNGTLKLTSAPADVREVLDLTDVTRVIEIYDTEDKAIKSFA